MRELPRRAGPDPRRGLGQPVPDREGRRRVRPATTRRRSSCSPTGPAIAIENARLYRAVERAARRARAGGARARGDDDDRPRGRRRDRPRPRARADRQARPRARRGARRADPARARATSSSSPPRAGEAWRSRRACASRSATRRRASVLSSRARERVARRRAGSASARRRLGVPDAEPALLVPLVFRGARARRAAAFDRLPATPGSRADDEQLLEAFAASAATAVATAQTSRPTGCAQHRGGRGRAPALGARAARRDAAGARRRCRCCSSRRRAAATPTRCARRSTSAVEQIGTEIDEPAGADHRAAPGRARRARPGARARARSPQRTGEPAGLEVETDLRARRRATRGCRAELETTVYRLVQEALTNVVKHARAPTASTVAVREADGALDVARRPTTAAASTRDGRGAASGWSGMRERVELAGGELQGRGRRGGRHGRPRARCRSSAARLPDARPVRANYGSRRVVRPDRLCRQGRHPRSTDLDQGAGPMPEEPTAVDELSPQQLDEVPEHLEDRRPRATRPPPRRPRPAAAALRADDRLLDRRPRRRGVGDRLPQRRLLPAPVERARRRRPAPRLRRPDDLLVPQGPGAPAARHRPARVPPRVRRRALRHRAAPAAAR